MELEPYKRFPKGSETYSEEYLEILPMKEYERLFAQNNENGIAQFWHFGHDKHKGPVSSHTILFNKTAKRDEMSTLLQKALLISLFSVIHCIPRYA